MISIPLFGIIAAVISTMNIWEMGVHSWFVVNAEKVIENSRSVKMKPVVICL